MTSKIEWTDATWNPWIGCSRISPGCDNCYAGREEDGRFRHLGRCAKGLCWPLAPPKGQPYFFRGPRFQGEVKLSEPLHWRKARHVFVCSRSDLFHEDISFDRIQAVFVTMWRASQHTFQVLTKRPERMLAFFAYAEKEGLWGDAWPLRNVWTGVTAEDQARADERIPLLLQCPAAVRYVSIEPMIGPVSLSRRLKWPVCKSWRTVGGDPDVYGKYKWKRQCLASADWRGVDWVITGGESGRGARPMHPDWARDIRDQCEVAGVPFFFKQWGEFLALPDAAKAGIKVSMVEAMNANTIGGGFLRVGKKKAGRLLDGKLHDAMPVSGADKS